MNSKEIIDYLKSEASEKYKENVIKMGIPEKFCIGVSTSTLRKFAKKLDKSNELAFELWNTHYHEARLLAVLIFDHKCLSYDQIDTLMSEVLSWDLCDHLCKNLIIKLDYYEDFIFNWIAADHIYKKRASFVLIAASTIHDKSMTKETLDIYLKLVYENSCYEHDHIKKAVSWALREIGKSTAKCGNVRFRLPMRKNTRLPTTQATCGTPAKTIQFYESLEIVRRWKMQ